MYSLWKSVLAVGSISGLFSLGWNIYLHKEKKREGKLASEMELKILNVRKLEIEEKYDKAKGNLYNFTGSAESYFDTASEKLIALENELGKLEENRRHEILEIEAREEYLKNIS